MVSNVSLIFKSCVSAIRNGELIEREGRNDKEFHFQNWFKRRLEGLGLNYDSPGRNTYPDFRLVRFAEGYELKGLLTQVVMQIMTAIARSLAESTMGGKSIMCLAVIRAVPTAIVIRCLTWFSATEAS